KKLHTLDLKKELSMRQRRMHDDDYDNYSKNQLSRAGGLAIAGGVIAIIIALFKFFQYLINLI
ncbi:MAG: hypothetical protein WKF91_09685, partial [Segetibacter sp.]